ncbi:hypothetical protein COCNU_09G006760 [Cocos nucifera]|uniref:Uncharacterized protein n=1 Tax=Cocos nucifera TaxID=13894 RepID=A0A8K0IJS0_COCNU|nr:hypothetical protein COCNU_09G006760 [Cocos nucifera]
MASLSGILHRPLSTATVIALAAISTDLPDRFYSSKPSELDAASRPASAVVSEPPLRRRISFTDLLGVPFVSKARADVPVQNLSFHHVPDFFFGSCSIPASSPPVLRTVYHYAKLADPATYDDSTPSIPLSPSEVVYRWHLADPRAYGVSEKDGCSAFGSQTVVVLLGWLGAKQRHLKSYGAILEKFRKHDPSIMGKIKGSIVDSAPVAAPDPQFSCVATKGMLSSNGLGSGMMVAADSGVKAKPAVTEVALLAVLEKIFEVVPNLPAINR